jgi:hypothetical protein
MSQRDSGYARKERDEYNTPFWVAEALLPHIPPPPCKILEPACGEGNIVRVLADAGYNVHASDLIDGENFLECETTHGADGIITNPPYTDVDKFIQRAIDVMMPRNGFVCMLLSQDFSCAKSRRHLFADCPIFAKKVELTKRIVWFERPDGKRAAPSENHAWYIWAWSVLDLQAAGVTLRPRLAWAP